jgi:hypothetical protein
MATVAMSSLRSFVEGEFASLNASGAESRDSAKTECKREVGRCEVGSGGHVNGAVVCSA